MAGAVIIDCDPGVDDAIALLLAFGAQMPVMGVTTVAGNVPLSLTYGNARKICELAGSEVPVFAGCPRPLIRPLATAEEMHGATGLQGADLPEPEGERAIAAQRRFSHSAVAQCARANYGCSPWPAD